MIDGAVKELHRLAFDTEDAASYEFKRKYITQAALRVIAESMSTDGAANARRSKRDDSLTLAIEEEILDSETRSRQWVELRRETHQAARQVAVA